MSSGFVTGLRQFSLGALRLIPVIAVALLPLSATSVTADSSGQQKISPALLAAITANPLQRYPVIVEMNPPAAPFTSGANQALAQQAVSILNANGLAFGGLSLVQGAAGFANAAGITAISQLPQVAAIL